MTFVNPELFTAYLVATVALILLPGPIVTLVVANSVAHGTRTGLATVAGTTTGNALLVAVGALGLGALLAVLAELIHWVRWAGVVYLVYLGLREWRSVFRLPPPDAVPMRSARSVFGQGVLVAITNPKTIFFYVAFFPQFLDTRLSTGTAAARDERRLRPDRRPVRQHLRVAGRASAGIPRWTRAAGGRGTASPGPCSSAPASGSRWPGGADSPLSPHSSFGSADLVTP